MNINTDYILIRDAKRGNTKAVERIIRKYYVSIFDFCRYHSNDVYTAEDLTQEFFLTFIKGIHQYVHNGKLLNYLYTIARNKCIDEKKRMRNTEISIDCVVSRLNSSSDSYCSDIEYLDTKIAVERLPDDIALRYLSSNGNWYYVIYNVRGYNEYGYIHKSQLSR